MLFTPCADLYGQFAHIAAGETTALSGVLLPHDLADTEITSLSRRFLGFLGDVILIVMGERQRLNQSSGQCIRRGINGQAPMMSTGTADDGAE